MRRIRARTLTRGVAYTEADLAAIQTAIAKGERTVAFADRSVTYRSAEELLALEARILSDLAAQAERPRQHKVVADKGFCL